MKCLPACRSDAPVFRRRAGRADRHGYCRVSRVVASCSRALWCRPRAGGRCATLIDRIARLRRITAPSIAPSQFALLEMVTELSDRNVVLDRDIEELVALGEERGIALEVDENFDQHKGWVFDRFTMRLPL